MHGDTMNNSDELTHKKMKIPSYCQKKTKWSRPDLNVSQD